MDLNELLQKWNTDLKALVGREYVSKQVILNLLNEFSQRIETINWGGKQNTGIQYAPKQYVSAQILEELKKICQIN